MDLKDIKTFEELKMAKAKFYAKDSEFTKLKESIRTADHSKRGEIGKKLSALKNEAEEA